MQSSKYEFNNLLIDVLTFIPAIRLGKVSGVEAGALYVGLAAEWSI
jgi:hypothetical protein